MSLATPPAAIIIFKLYTKRVLWYLLFSLLFLCSKFYISAELQRKHYLETLGSLFPTPIRHIIKQEEMFDDVIRLYRNNPSVLAFPVYRNQHSWCHAVNVKWSHPSFGKSKFIHFLCLCKNTECDSNAVVKHWSWNVFSRWVRRHTDVFFGGVWKM